MMTELDSRSLAFARSLISIARLESNQSIFKHFFWVYYVTMYDGNIIYITS